MKMGRDNGWYVRYLLHIRLLKRGLPTLGCDLRRSRFAALYVQVPQYDGSAGRRQRFSHCKADPTRGTRYHGRFALN